LKLKNVKSRLHINRRDWGSLSRNGKFQLVKTFSSFEVSKLSFFGFLKNQHHLFPSNSQLIFPQKNAFNLGAKDPNFSFVFFYTFPLEHQHFF